jgi:signal recognition particle receptor subunit beta
LSDDKFGDITTVHAAAGAIEEVLSTNCNGLIGAANKIGVSSNKSCKFVGRILATGLHENVVTGSATDGDGVTTDGTSTPPLKDNAKVQVTVTLNP